MARKLRIVYPGAIYHVTIRGVDRRSLFEDTDDRERFLLRLGEAVEVCGVRLYLFCCMRNHVHLVVETPTANLSAFMHKLQTAYTVYYNRRHRRSGHLMQGRYGALLVQGDAHLLNLSRYVHVNPVRAGSFEDRSPEQRLQALRHYRWSSYRGYAGLEPSRAFVTEGPLLALIAGSRRFRRRAYRRFVEEGLCRPDEVFRELLKDATWGIGDGHFREGIRALHAELAGKARRPEDVSFRKTEPVCEAEEVLGAVAQRFGVPVESLKRRQYGCQARAVAAYLLGRYAGMSQRDIGTFLGMGGGSAVCRQLQSLRRALPDDPDLSAHMAALTSRMLSVK